VSQPSKISLIKAGVGAGPIARQCIHE
jgi:hypothetical protein